MKLTKISEKIVKEVLALKKNDNVLIITNPERDVYEISFSLLEVCKGISNKVQFLVQPKKDTMDFAEDYVIKALEQEPSVIISISTNRLGKDRFRLKRPLTYKNKNYTHIFDYLFFGKKNVRGFWSPGITKNMFLRCIDIDYKKLRKKCKILAKVISNADTIHIKTKKGTNITFSTKQRKAHVDDGDFRKPGNGGNLPTGEVFISPSIASAEGRIVFDGSLSYGKGSLILKNPVIIEFKNGYVAKIKGGNEARIFAKEIKKGIKKPFEVIKNKKLAKEYSKNAKHLGEFGIGLNPKAKIVGNVLEDEKVLSTIHLAIGANYDQDARALIHFDGLVLKPTVKVDDRLIMSEGKLLI
jgi:leucyl aminopeptidase (aminopeptidase T)